MKGLYSFSSLANKEQIIKESYEFKRDIKIIIDNQIDMNTILEKVNSIPSNSAILFTSLYKDKNENFITSFQLREFFNASKYPVFALNKIHLGEGIVGGIMVSAQEQGILAAKKTIEILNGKKANEIAISTPTSKYYFDYKV